MLEFVGGLIVGGIIIGVIANRKPLWFSSIVRAANAIDDKANTTIGPAVKDAISKVKG